MPEQDYGAQNIQVLEGLEAVRKRPGMYTDTTRPNHLAQEVIDNSVDEAIAPPGPSCVHTRGWPPSSRSSAIESCSVLVSRASRFMGGWGSAKTSIKWPPCAGNTSA